MFWAAWRGNPTSRESASRHGANEHAYSTPGHAPDLTDMPGIPQEKAKKRREKESCIKLTEVIQAGAMREEKDQGCEKGQPGDDLRVTGCGLRAATLGR